MAIDERMLGVIEAIYDAAMDELRWPDALQKLNDLTGSLAASFWVLDGSPQPRLPTFNCINFDPAFIAEYLDHMVPHDPTVQYLIAHPETPIVHDGMVIAESEKDRHFYYDWHGRHSDTRFRLVGQAHPAPAVQAGVALHRQRKVGRYESRDIEQFAVLHRHIERALAIGFRLGSLGTMQQCTTALLDRNPAAILLLDEQQRVVYANSAADAFRSKGDGIKLVDDGLSLLHHRDNERLRSLIAAALTSTRSAGADPGGVMRAARPSGCRPYLIVVTPVSKHYPAFSFLRPAICIVITDPDGCLPLSHERLCATFGLTEAEARLAARLTAGDDLRTAAARLGIGYGTARARLVEIFQKTETHRQGELIKLLLTTLNAG